MSKQKRISGIKRKIRALVLKGMHRDNIARFLNRKGITGPRGMKITPNYVSGQVTKINRMYDKKLPKIRKKSIVVGQKKQRKRLDKEEIIRVIELLKEML